MSLCYGTLFKKKKKNFVATGDKKKRTVHLTRFLLRQGEPGTSQYAAA